MAKLLILSKSEISKRLWRRKSYRKLQEENRNLKLKSKVMKEVWERPGHRELISKKATGRITTEGVKKKHSLVSKELWKNKEYRKKQKEARTTPEYLARRHEIGRDTILKKRPKPNNSEKLLKNLLHKNFPGEFRLNVKGKVSIDGKIPDFVNINGRKALVELFGVHWHTTIKDRTRLEAVRERRKAFSRWGFKTFIVWEDELKRHSENVVKRLKDFLLAC
jgi:very-short-patch-repair endonuclease